MGRGYEEIVLQRRKSDGQQTHEKMFHIVNYWGNAKKTTMTYHLTLVRVANIEKTSNNKCWQECGESGTLLHCWWEGKLVQAVWKQY